MRKTLPYTSHFFFLAFNNFNFSFNISFLTVVFSSTVMNIPMYCASPSSISESFWLICSNICTWSESKQAHKCRTPLWHWEQWSQPWQENVISHNSLHATNQSRNNPALAHTNCRDQTSWKVGPDHALIFHWLCLFPLVFKKEQGLYQLEAAVMIFMLSAQCNQQGPQWTNTSEKPPCQISPDKGAAQIWTTMVCEHHWQSKPSSGYEERTVSPKSDISTVMSSELSVEFWECALISPFFWPSFHSMVSHRQLAACYI